MARARNPSRRAAPPSERPGLLARAAPWLGLAAVLVVTALAYQPALPGPFALDDWGSIEANMRLRAPDAVRVPSLSELLGPGRPVTELTFAIDWRAAGLDPVRFHSVSLGLHLLTVIAAFGFLFALLRRSGHPRPRSLALVISAIFALHPIQTESVAYAAQRAEILSSLLYLVSLLLLDRVPAALATWRGSTAWAGAALAWLLGMGSKTIAITVPGAFLLDQAIVAPAAEKGGPALRRRLVRAIAISAPLLALCAWSATLHLRSFAADPGGGAGFSATPLGASSYLLTQFRVVWLYLRLLAWPDSLAFDRSFPASQGVDAAVLAAGAGLAALVVLAGFLWFRAEQASGPRPAARLASFGIAFWFVVLSPTSSFVPVTDLAVEHRVYLASLGVFLAAVVGADALLHQLLPRPRAALAGGALAALALFALGLGLASRARVWSSSEALWRSSAEASPDNARSWTNLGLALQRKGNPAGAEAAYLRAWTVVRQQGRAASLARNHSSLLIEGGRPVEALAIAERGLAIIPGEPSLHANSAAALSRLGRTAEALEAAHQAARAAPGNPLIRNLLGQALTMTGDWPGALAEFQAAEGLDPGNPLYPVAAGVVLSSLGRRDEACAAFRRAGAISGSRPLPLDAARRASDLGCPILSP